MKHKLFFFVLSMCIATCFCIQSCNSEDNNLVLNEEDKIAEMFREAGFGVKKLSERANTSMTEEEALKFLKAYGKRERTGSVQIPSSHIEVKPDGRFIVKVKHNPGQKNFSRTRADNTEEFNFSHWTEFTQRDIYIECYQEKYGAQCWRSDNVTCDATSKNSLYRCDIPDIDPDCGYSPSYLEFKINIRLYIDSGWNQYSFNDNYRYTLMLAWAELAGEWVGSLSWEEISW